MDQLERAWKYRRLTSHVQTMPAAPRLPRGHARTTLSRVELQSTKRQCELVKSLLADATAENEIMYEAFNEARSWTGCLTTCAFKFPRRTVF
ncbi:hypothetical protein V8E53_009119, partial [Lactarius tabidus]